MTAPPLKGPAPYFFIGGVFGVALSTYLALCKGYRSISKIVLLVAVSIIAYFAAVNVPKYSPPLHLPLLGRDQLELSLVFEGGVIGGFLLLTAVLLLFRLPGSDIRAALLKATLWSLASGLLGAVAWLLGPSVGDVLWALLPTSALPSQENLHLYSLYFIWQTGIAILIGFIVQGEEKYSATAASTQDIATRLGPSHHDNFFFTRRKFFAVVAVLLALACARAIPIRVSVARRQQASDRMLSDIPPNDGLPLIQPMTIDQALIMNDIAGFQPGKPVSQAELQSHEKNFQLPPAMYYAVSYIPKKGNSNGSNVSVSVEQYPNSPWAFHFAEYPPRIYNSFDNPKHHAIATRFQNNVRTNLFERSPVGVPLYYMWPSGNNVVTVTYNTQAEVAEILRVYLEKYPSSIK